MNKTYTLLAESTSPVFDLEALGLPGGKNVLVVTASDGTNETDYSDEVEFEQEYDNYVIDKSTLTSIADSIRGKTGRTDPILTENISAEIDTLLFPTGTKAITTNGTHDVTEYASADVQVPQPSGPRPDSITENGEYDVTDYESVNVQVPQPSGPRPDPITENGEYDVTDYESVNVSLPEDVYLDPSEALRIQFKDRLDFSTIYGADMQERFPKGIVYTWNGKSIGPESQTDWHLQWIIFDPEGLKFVATKYMGMDPYEYGETILVYDARTNEWPCRSVPEVITLYSVNLLFRAMVIPSTLYRWLELNADITLN